MNVFDLHSIRNVNMAFESYVINVLADYLETQHKRIDISSYTNVVDSVLPDGIDSIENTVYVEVKKFNNKKSNYWNSLDVFSNKLEALPKGSILVILGDRFDSKSKDNMAKLLKSRCGMKALIWDVEDFNQKMGEHKTKHLELLTNPAKALINNALNNTYHNDIDRRNRRNSLLDNLKRKYRSEEVTLVLGAGVSIDGGIPLWRELNNKLLSKMISQVSEGKTIESLDEIIALANKNQDNSPIIQTRIIRSVFSNNEFSKLLQEVIYESKLNYNTKLINEITNLCIPKRNHIGVQGIITYNFDDLLEKSLKKNRVNYKTISCNNDIPEWDKLNIYHVHGYLPKKLESDIDRDIDLIFSEEDYHKVYRDSFSWSNIVQINAFRESTCLFIGCSLTDPNLRRLLDISNRNNENPRHFAIMKRRVISTDGEFNSESIEYYRDLDEGLVEQYYSLMGINIIWIDDFGEIPLILSEFS